MENEITIKDYLSQKGIESKEVNGELATSCFFNDCDKDSGNNERHLYFNAETGQYQCKKCGTAGNLVTLRKYFGDNPSYAPKKIPVSIRTVTKKLNPDIADECHNNLPDRIKEYLNARGITDEIIEKQKIGWGEFYRQKWITIPVFNASGKCIFLKLRKDPDNQTKGPKYLVFPAGSQAEIYGRENLTETNSELVICEGEFDCLILSKFNIPAITSTAGAATFKKKWLNELEGFAKIYVALDKDEAGEKGADTIVELLTKNLPDTDIYKITLPERMTEGKDITDYFTRYDGNAEEFMFQLPKLVIGADVAKQNESKEIKNERFIHLSPKTKTEINEWKNILSDNFPDLAFAAEAGLSTLGQLLIDDIKNPFALVYVDVPSSGKTITLNFFSTIKELIYTTDNFTPAAFVSHAANRTEKKLAEIDLLPKIQYRAMVVRDLAPIFAKREEDVQAMLGILIRVLDGEGYESDSGLHGKRGYIGDYLFMLLAASTPIRPRIWKIMGNLGSRLFFLNINGKEKDETELANQLVTSCGDKELMCREATENLIKTLWSKYPNGIHWSKEKDDQHLREIIARLAGILAKLRSPMNIEEEYSDGKKYTHHQSDPEMPDRLNQLLYNFARGHALVCGCENISNEDIKATMRVALDSAPPNRAKLFKNLICNDGQLSTNEVMGILNYSRPMALKFMKDLVILKIVNTEGNMEDDSDDQTGRPKQKIILKDKYNWFISEECKELLTDRTGGAVYKPNLTLC